MSRTERYHSVKPRLKPEYEQYTLGLALFDMVPVLLFFMSGLILWTMYGKPLFLAGVIVSFIGGICKVLWKLIVVLGKRDRRGLTTMFHIMLPGGFVLMLLSVVIDVVRDSMRGTPFESGSTLVGLWNGLTMMPATLLFILGGVGLLIMGLLGANMDESKRASWIEELVNAVSQGAILAAVVIVYLGTFYHAADAAATAMESTDKVRVSGISVQSEQTADDEESDEEALSEGSSTEEDDNAIEDGNVYFFDGPGTDTALIFYPGAKVEVYSYAPLMTELSDRGIDCYLCQMPENLAMLDKDLARDVRGANNYEHWYIGGHSLGGATAAMFLADQEKASGAGSWDGLILLAAYPTDKLRTPVLSIYGTEDKVLNHDKYVKAQTDGLWPEDFTELVIEGGNHAQFGDYGEQKDDGTATITAEEQIKQTVKAVDKWVEEHN